MPITAQTFFKGRDQILLEMIAQLQGSVADAYVGDDGIIFIMFQIESAQIENLSLANQILLQECFPQTASASALTLYGEMFSIPMLLGTPAIGQVTFTGEDATQIPVGTLVGAPRGPGLDPLLFATDTAVALPATGAPLAPSAAVNVTAGNLNGNYEYKVTFVTAVGETLPSPESIAVSPVNQQVNLTSIPIGGASVTQRKIYRLRNGAGLYQLVTTIANNTATTYTDNITDAAVAAGAYIPTTDTAHKVTVDATAVNIGQAGNVSTGTITLLVNVPQGIQSVTNLASFTDGSDDEEIEEYRRRLMERIGNPNTGSASDLKSWAEAVPGVEQATVFVNDNLGTPTNGHVTVRIAGPGGAIPDAGTVADVQAALDEQNVANITVHVATFNQLVQNVTVDVTTDATSTLPDVTPQVQQAITNYIEELPVGGTLRVAGIVDAVFGLAGVVDVTVTSPATNQTATSIQKFVAGTITVT